MRNWQIWWKMKKKTYLVCSSWQSYLDEAYWSNNLGEDIIVIESWIILVCWCELYLDICELFWNEKWEKKRGGTREAKNNQYSECFVRYGEYMYLIKILVSNGLRCGWLWMKWFRIEHFCFFDKCIFGFFDTCLKNNQFLSKWRKNPQDFEIL